MATSITEPGIFAPGIHQNIPEADYHAAPGLSNSGMKDLLVSPLRYWYLHINPTRPPDKETPEMQIGTALHCAVLEPERFDVTYTREICEEDFPDCLVTMDDMRTWLKSKGLSFTAKTKADLVKLIQTFCYTQSINEPPILDVLKARHEEACEGLIQLPFDAWDRVCYAREALRNEPKLKPIIADGTPEVSIFVADPETGVPLKGRLDWISGDTTLDLKTFSQQRGHSIDKSIGNAIFYEGYYRQAYFYWLLRTLTSVKNPKSIMAFVESEKPHEVRLKEFRRSAHGMANVYWERARLEVQSLIATYAHYWKKFGNDPWLDEQDIDIVLDDELPNLAY